MMVSPVTEMINQAEDYKAWETAAVIVKAKIRAGEADSGLVFHLMARGMYLLREWEVHAHIPAHTLYIAQHATRMGAIVTEIIATEVRKS